MKMFHVICYCDRNYFYGKVGYAGVFRQLIAASILYGIF